MATFALFDFFDENTIDVGEWEWVVDYLMIDVENLSRSTEVIVQWPLNSKCLKNLGKKQIHIVEGQTKECAAYVLKTSSDLQHLREIANKLSKGSDRILSPKSLEKRFRKKNSKYLDEDDGDDEITKPVAPTRKRKAMAVTGQDVELSRKIADDLNVKLKCVNEAKKFKETESNDEDEDLFEELILLKKRIKHLERENEKLQEDNKNLSQMLQNQKNIPDILAAFKKMEERFEGISPSAKSPSVKSPVAVMPPGSPSMSPLPPLPSKSPLASRPPLALRSPLASINMNKSECKMITLWENVEVTEAQWKLLYSKKGSVREYTNQLLRMLYTSEMLSSNSLTGKTSNAFKSSKVAKPQLKDVDNVISLITRDTSSDEKKVKAAITQLLNTESKRVKDDQP